jgi:hypothetical protein
MSVVKRREFYVELAEGTCCRLVGMEVSYSDSVGTGCSSSLASHLVSHIR